MERAKLILLVFLITVSNALGLGLIRYVDNNSPGGNDGLTIGTAWDSLTQITGVGAGDTVYVSGGSTSKVYTMGGWQPPSGSPTNQCVITINPNAGHNGIAIFRSDNTNSFWAGGLCNYVTISGRLNNTNHFRVENYGISARIIADGGPAPTGVKLLGWTMSGNGCLKLYDTRKIEVGWMIFEPFKRFAPNDCQMLLGVGRGDETGFGNNSIHDCEFYYYYRYGVNASGNNGNDCMDHLGSVDIYNNKFIGVYAGAGQDAGDDHQDVIMSDGRYFRIWNNYFENSAQYMIFGGFFGSGNSDWQIFNNVFNFSDTNLLSQQSVPISIGSHQAGATYTRFWIWNNTIYRGSLGIALGTPADGDTGSNNIVQNNIVYGTTNQIVSGTTISNNTSGTSGISFISATNLRLQAGSTAAINQGITLSGLNATSANDADGNARTPPWDIGAYEFGAGGADTTPPTLTSAVVGADGVSWVFTLSENGQIGAGGTGGWVLTMSGGAVTLSSIVASGATVAATGSRAAGGAETGTIAYTQPTNGVEDTAGNDLASLSGFTIGNTSEQGRVATPEISPGAGPYFGPQTITITCATGSSTIYYTLDGSTPTTGSTEYTAPFVLPANATVKTFATASGLVDSTVASAIYELILWEHGPIVQGGQAFKTFVTPTQAGMIAWKFRASVSVNPANALIGLASEPTDDFPDLGIIIRFGPTGQIDVRNGADYSAAATVNYAPATYYDFIVTANVVTRKVTSVKVTPLGGAQTELTNGNYDFRTDSPTASLDNVGTWRQFGVLTTENMSFGGTAIPGAVQNLTIGL